jgi:hypothetical protein
MIPYLIISLLAVITIFHASVSLSYPQIKISTNLTLLPLVLTSTLIAGLRYQTGGDWELYNEWYDTFSFDTIFVFGVEPGWILYSIALRNLGLDFNTYILVTSVISNCLIYSGLSILLEEKRITAICFGFYALIVFYSAQMFYIRSGLAVGLFLVGIGSGRRSTSRTVLFILLSGSIHSGVAFAGLVYGVIRLSLQNRLFILASAFGLALLFSELTEIVLPEVYISGEFADSRSITVKAAFGIVLLATLIVNIESFKKNYSPEVTAIAISALIVPNLFNSFEVGGRVRMFFSPMDGLPIYFFVKTIVGQRYAIAPMLLIALLFVFIYWTDPYVISIFVPYKNWLSLLF